MEEEIKTGKEIYLEGLDVKEANKESNYNDRTTKIRREFNIKKWISYEDYEKAKQDGIKEGRTQIINKLKEYLGE